MLSGPGTFLLSVAYETSSTNAVMICERHRHQPAGRRDRAAGMSPGMSSNVRESREQDTAASPPIPQTQGAGLLQKNSLLQNSLHSLLQGVQLDGVQQ